MARKRMISPTIWEDPSFNRLSIGARLLFIGMISNADDEGYIRGDIGSLKRLIFGFDETLGELSGWIKELGNLRNIHFYKVDDEQYAHLTKWEEYQKQRDDRIQPSAYPPCAICQTSVRQVPDKSGQVSAKDSGKSVGSKDSESEASTPSEEAKRLFGSPDQIISYLINRGMSEPIAQKEAEKFIRHWTEPNKSGTKVRWQLEKTFEIRRRLNKWQENAEKWNTGPKGENENLKAHELQTKAEREKLERMRTGARD